LVRSAPRLLAFAAAAGLACASLTAATMPAQAATQNAGSRQLPASPAKVTAAAAELINGGTGQVMWTRNMNVKRPVASITKVMTALVVLEAGSLNRKVKVTRAAEQYGLAYDPGEAGLHPGDVLTTRQVLEGMLLPSGSDAAYLLATTYGPGWPAFVRKMNREAGQLGMTRTHFANFDGLPWPSEHSTYSTAHDLALLARAAMKQPAFRQIVKQRSHWIGATSQHGHYYWTNTNLLLRRYRGAIGIKTGYTAGAGYCLLFAASRNGTELVGVVLDSTKSNAQIRFTAASNLLTWGFGIARPAG
jgi:serine-type D-Ala-D-Ala carboxypeptidase (penicillin-binding protein 5/6)